MAKNIRKAVLLLAMLSVIVGMFTACSNKKSDDGRTTFTVGFDAEFPPYGYKDDSGEYVGFDLDLAQEVCERNGWNLVKQPIDWDSKDSASAALQNGGSNRAIRFLCQENRSTYALPSPLRKPAFYKYRYLPEVLYPLELSSPSDAFSLLWVETYRHSTVLPKRQMILYYRLLPANNHYAPDYHIGCHFP